ncbi:MAG TPA: Trm112 family protein [Gemmatirosa sp.]|jgi:uncharacterized protein YbaR (Trm112 family)|nr:Trm112 family protein [Gemmatirosa sp.]
MTTPIPPALRELLVCPRCKGALVDRPDGSALECPVCRLAYPVRDGIPIMLIDEATPL